MELNRDVLRKLPLALRIEIDENAGHKPLTQSELAIEHQTPGKRTDLQGAKVTSEKTFSEVRATALVGKLFNESHKQVEKRFAIVDAAETEPEKYGRLLEDMDRTGRVNGVYRRLKIAKQAAEIRKEPPPLPGNGPYRVVVIDPAWPYELRDEDPSRRGVRDYPSMSIEEICKVEVRSIMHEDSIIFMWVTNFVLVQGIHTTVLQRWGEFEAKTLITWPKDKMGNGDWLRSQTEHVIMAVRGKPVVESANLTTLLKGPFHLVRKNAHSSKPVEFYDFVEKLCAAPRYADLCSRYQHNDKWDCHGDEAPRPSLQSS
jgi:N6-adenosine-specific RNA methylase IME4